MSKKKFFVKSIKNINDFINNLLEKNLNKLNIKNLNYLFKNNKNLKINGKNNISPNFLKKMKFKPISINLSNDKLLIKEF